MHLFNSLLVLIAVAIHLAGGYVISEQDLRGRQSGLDPTLFARMQHYAQYVEAGYDPRNTAVQTASRPVQGVNLPATIEWSIQKTKIADTEAFIARDSKEIVMVIRGSVSVANWFSDLNFRREGVKFCAGCEVHGGFATAWQEMKPAAVTKLMQLAQKYPGHKIIVVGHSLGAAIATLAGFDLRLDPKLGSRIEMFAYASPKVGNQRLADWMTKQRAAGFPAYRINATKDPVPHLPFDVMGFAHFQPSYYIKANAEKPTITDIQVRQQDASEVLVTPQAHLNYFMAGIDHLAGNPLARLIRGQFPTWSTMFKTMAITRRALRRRSEALLMSRDMLRLQRSVDPYSWVW